MQNNNNQMPKFTWVNILISIILIVIFGGAEILITGHISLLAIPAIFLCLTLMDRISYANDKLNEANSKLDTMQKELEEIKELLNGKSDKSEE